MTMVYIYLFIYKLIYRAPSGRHFRGVVSSQRWPKTIPVLIASTRNGQAEWPSGWFGVTMLTSSSCNDEQLYGVHSHPLWCSEHTIAVLSLVVPRL